MSNPVTNEEVEDVLSSIRRLVSEDKRPMAGMRNVLKSSTEDASGKPDPAKQDKLVLTPALRVAEAPVDRTVDTPLDLGQVAKRTWTGAGEEQDSASPMAEEPSKTASDDAPLFPESVDATSEQADDLQDDGAQDGEFDALDALVQDAVAEGLAEQSRAEPDTKVAFDQPADEKPEADADWRDVALMHDDDFDEDYGDAQAWEEDESPVASETERTEKALRSLRSLKLDPETAMDDAPESTRETMAVASDSADGPVDATAQGEDDSMDFVPLTAKIAALETAIGSIRQDWEPDGPGTDDNAGSEAPAMAWEDDVELDATGTPMNEMPTHTEEPAAAKRPVEPAQTAESVNDLAVDDALMDEEALRDLVSEIVRAELQGALGERITRNVRKLVRREIHRALTAQDME